MKKKSESVNDKAKALLELITPEYVPESEIPDHYLNADQIAKLNEISTRCARERLAKLYQAGKIASIKVKRKTGYICNYYAIK